jgi:hypothetical protein
MGMDRLRVLDLEGNQIRDLATVRFLSCCSHLTSLTLTGNPAARSAKAYTHAVVEMLPHLAYLDERRVRGRRPVAVRREARAREPPVAPPPETPSARRPRVRKCAGSRGSRSSPN